MPERAEHEKNSSDTCVPLHLWLASPKDVVAGEDDADSIYILSDEENARFKAFKFERDRREYLTTRLLVRNALSHYHPNSPEAWRFKANSHGKPAVDPDCDLRFNVSNSHELVVCLLGRGVEVGIDAEPLDRAPQAASVSKEFLSPLELGQLEELSEKEKLDRTLSLWTLKESYIKARGLGLSLPLQEFSFVFGGPAGVRLRIPSGFQDDETNWRFCIFDLAEHRVALFVETKDEPHLETWDARSLISSPVRRVTAEAIWFPRFR